MLRISTSKPTKTPTENDQNPPGTAQIRIKTILKHYPEQYSVSDTPHARFSNTGVIAALVGGFALEQFGRELPVDAGLTHQIRCPPLMSGSCVRLYSRALLVECFFLDRVAIAVSGMPRVD